MTKFFCNKNILFDFVYLFGTIILLNILILVFSYLIFSKPLFDSEDLKLLNFEKVILFVFIIPIIEEFSIRGIFVFNNKIYIIISLISIILLLFVFINDFLISLILSFLIVVFGIFILLNSDLRLNFNIFIKNNYIYILIISSIIFGILHLGNYDTIDFHTFLKIIPRFIMGFYLGYIAYKYSIFHSYIMHSVNNVIPFLILLLQQHLKL